MRKIFTTAVLALALVACKQETATKTVAETESNEVELTKMKLYGEDFKNQAMLTSFELGDIYSNLKAGDTINVSFKSSVEQVCQEKGCWMQVDVGAVDPVMIKFKDYAFFVPKDIKDKSVMVHGVAYVSETPVEEQRHYAKDAGKSQEEIDAIKTPKRSFSFLASGVKVAQ